MGENIYKRNRNSFSLLDKYVLLFWNRIYIIVRDLRQCVEFYQIYGDVYNKKEGPHDFRWNRHLGLVSRYKTRGKIY